jgi:hypothetical protein
MRRQIQNGTVFPAKGLVVAQPPEALYRKAIGSLLSEIRQEREDVTHRNHAD